MSWCSGLEAICRADVPLAEYTWYGLGGAARWFCTPRDEGELAELLARCRGAGMAWRVLGRGANVLVRDAGFDGAVLHLCGPAWEALRFDGPALAGGAGADFPKLVKKSAERGLAGLEGLAGIPGTLGGAIRMNAGGKYGSIGTTVRRVRVMRPDGEIETRAAAQVAFGYRTSRLDGAIVLAAELELAAGDREALVARFRTIWNEKAANQPPLSAKSAGCIFKNPPGAAAGALIDQAGLKGVRRGAAEISSRHANFILAYPGARAQDILDLVALAQERVAERFDVKLELEVDVW